MPETDLEVGYKLSALNTLYLCSPFQERLRSHAESFNSLLQLIPAKLYYGEGDTSVCVYSCDLLLGNGQLMLPGPMAKKKADQRRGSQRQVRETES